MDLIQFKRTCFEYSLVSDFSFKLNQFVIKKGSHVFIEGPSGSGKTTFLNLIVGLLSPQAGSISVLGTDITGLSMSKLDRFRSDHFGIIFQLFNLLPYLSVIENISLPCLFSRSRKHKVLQHYQTLSDAARHFCVELDIDDRLLASPVQQLSIGQQQRVAIARALIGQPEIIIADEPVSMLDVSIRAEILELMKEIQSKNEISMIYITHDLATAKYFADSIVILNSGKVMEIGPIDKVLLKPENSYTKALIAAISEPDPDNLYKMKQVSL